MRGVVRILQQQSEPCPSRSDPEEHAYNPARRCHTFGGRRIETPPGGEHRRPPTLGAFVIEVLFWQAFLAFLAI